MVYTRILLALLFLGWTTIPSFTQVKGRSLVHYDQLNGNSILDIRPDSHGYVWLATHNGLLRFDGYDFKRYYFDPNDSSSISTVLTTSLFEDNKGRIWIGGVNDVNLFDPGTGKFQHHNFVSLTGFQTSAEPLVSTIQQDNDGRIIFGLASNYTIRSATNPLVSFDEGKGIIKPADYPFFEHMGRVNGSAKDSHGTMWFVFSQGLLRIKADGSIETIPLPTGARYASGIAINSDGIWISTDMPVLHRYDPVAKAYSEYPLVNGKTDLSQIQIQRIFSDTDRRVWIGTSIGVYYLDAASSHVEVFDIPVKENESLSQVTSFAEDSFGNLWIGTLSNGLFRVEKRSAFRSMVGTGRGNKNLLGGWVDTMVEGSDGNMWLTSSGQGYDDSGVSIVNLESGVAEHHTFGSLADNFYGSSSIHEYEPGVMYITTNLGLITLSMDDLELKRVETPGVNDSIQIEFYFRDTKGTEWIGTRAFGLFERRKNQKAYVRHDLSVLPGSNAVSNDVIELVESQTHGLWLLTNGGLFLYDYTSETIVRHGNDPTHGNVFSSQDINSLYDDDQGIVWVGTWQGGLIRYSVDTGKSKTYTINDGLPSMGIQKIIHDPAHENLWISTFDGICRFDLKTEEISRFSTDDGIHGPLFSDGAGIMTKEGYIVFGGSNGITYFKPDKILSNSNPPSVFLTGFKASNSTDGISDGIIQADIIELNHDQNNISLEYNGIHFSNPSRNKFEYMLEGYDPEWRQVGNQRSAYYTNLPPGEYVFRVKASNNNGVWNEDGAKLRIIIAPPWWQTPWAYGLYAMGFVGLMLVTDRYQRKRVIRIEREHAREKELAQGREIEKAYTALKATQSQLIQSEKMASLGELTAGIAHEIQNPLNFVNNFSEVNSELAIELEEAAAKGNLEEVLSLARSIRENEDKISNHGKRADGIVKSMLLHSRTSSGQKELTDINLLCDEYLRLAYHGFRAKDKSFNAKFEIEADSTLPKVNLVPQDIGRVILNLINNAFHAVSEKSKSQPVGYDPQVSIITKTLRNKIEIRVVDNGNGIPGEIKEKIFQPFFTTKPTGHGTGLGLSLSYDIVKAHSGELTVETKENEYTVFTVVLPI